jgi:hypothetical protein
MYINHSQLTNQHFRLPGKMLHLFLYEESIPINCSPYHTFGYRYIVYPDVLDKKCDHAEA